MIPMKTTTAQEQQNRNARRWAAQNTPCRKKLSREVEAFLLDKTFPEALTVLADTAQVIDPDGLYTQWALREGERIVDGIGSQYWFYPFTWLGAPDCEGIAEEVVKAIGPLMCVEGAHGGRWLLAEPAEVTWTALPGLVGLCARYGLRMDLNCASGRAPGLAMSIRLSINQDPAHVELEKAFENNRKAKAGARKGKEAVK